MTVKYWVVLWWKKKCNVHSVSLLLWRLGRRHKRVLCSWSPNATFSLARSLGSVLLWPTFCVFRFNVLGLYLFYLFKLILPSEGVWVCKSWNVSTRLHTGRYADRRCNLTSHLMHRDCLATARFYTSGQVTSFVGFFPPRPPLLLPEGCFDTRVFMKCSTVCLTH